MKRPIWSQQNLSQRDPQKLFLDRNESRNKDAILLTQKLLHEAIDQSVCQYYDLGNIYTMIEMIWGIPESNLYLTNGADGAIRNFFEYCHLKRHNHNCILMRPSYGMYEVYASQYFEKTLFIDYKHFSGRDSNEFESVVVSIKTSEPKSAFILANPESPTGVAYTQAQIDEIIQLACRYQIYLLIDSTYESYLPSSHKITPALNNANIFLAKSFSKSWSFAGMRLGYMQGNSESITSIKRTRPMYEIGTLQAKLLEKAIENRDLFERFTAETKLVKYNLLNSLNNGELETFDTYCNFIHIAEKSMTIQQIKKLSDIALYKKVNHKSLAGLIRLTVPSAEECDLITKVLIS